MSLVNIRVHMVWSTYKRTPYLRDIQLRNEMWSHIWNYCQQKKIFIDAVGGYDDHCHCLVAIRSDDTIARIANMIKGESAHWINSARQLNVKFAWGTGYYAASISNSMVHSVRQYIHNQERHHRSKTFKDEYEEFMDDNFGKGASKNFDGFD